MSIDNTANVLFDGNIITSNTVSTEVDLPLIITKSANYPSVISGQVLTYSILIENPNSTDVIDILFTDDYDSQVSYIEDSFKLDGIETTPDSTNPLTYTIDVIEASTSVTLEFSVLVL